MVDHGTDIWLSVVVPNYNHAIYITDCLQALAAQNCPGIEVIVVDDGSSDNSIEVISAFIEGRPGFRLLALEENQGTKAACDEGRRHMKGRYYYCGAADDRVQPGFFAAIKEMADRYPEAGILMGQMRIVDEEGNEIEICGSQLWSEPTYAEPERFLREFLDVEPPGHSLSAASIYRKSCFDEFGGLRKELLSWRDTFLQRLIGRKYGVAYVPVVGSNWMRRPTGFASSSRKDPRRMLDVSACSAWLMRNTYAEFFPGDFVDRWLVRFRSHIIESHLYALQQKFGTLREDCFTSSVVSGGVGRFLERLGACFFSLTRNLCCYIARRRLERYPGDVSAVAD